MGVFDEAAAELGCDPDELAGTFDSRTRQAPVPEMLPDGSCRGCGAYTGGKMPCAPDCPIDGEVG